MIKLKSWLAALLVACFAVTSALAQTGQLGPGQYWGNPGAAQGVARPTTLFVPSVASLKGVSVQDGQFVFVSGYYAANDGAGGVFVGSSSSAATDNGGTIIAPTFGSGRWLRVVGNVYAPEMFGARHNGSDDVPYIAAATSALNALYLAGGGVGTLRLTDGLVYTIGPSFENAATYSVTVWKPGVRYAGNGTLKLAANTAKASATFTATCSAGTTVTISGITGTPLVGDFLFGTGFLPATQLASGSGTSWVASQPCTASAAPTTSTTKFPRMVEAVAAVGAVNHVSMQDITLDYNGVNNMCAVAGSGTCWAFNASASIQVGDDITIQNVKFFNNSGSNDTEFGTNALPATVTNLKLLGNTHENSGDRINAAAADWSADFWIASGVTLDGAQYSAGPTINGSAFEAHGSAVTISNVTVRDYFNCGIISNEVASPSTNNVTLSNVSCLNVTFGGVVIGSRVGTNSNNVTIDTMQVLFLHNKSGYSVEGCSLTGSSTNINFNINNLTHFSDVTTDLGIDSSGVCLGNFVTAKVTDSQFYNTQGPAIRFSAPLASASITASGNQIYTPGRTSTTSLQAGIVLDASANVASNINIQNNPISGTVRYGVINAGVNASGGFAFGNASPGATIGQYNWTGTGVVPGTPPAGTSGQIQYNSAGALAGFTMAGDCTVSVPNITCLKTGGVAFGGLATVTPGTGVSAALAIAVGSAGSFVANGGALGSPSSVGTMPAFTLSGAISGGANQINNIIIGASTPLAGTFTTLGANTQFNINGKLTISATSPSIAGGFCTGAGVTGSNGTAAFVFNVGTACATSTGTLGMPTANAGWKCNFTDTTAPGTNNPSQTGSSTTTVAITNYSRTTGAATNFGSSDVIVGDCTAY